MVSPFPFVGRSQEQAQLQAHLLSAAAGRGRLVLVGGEAGAGKSALVQEAAAASTGAGAPATTATRFLFATGYCPGPGETSPFGPWLDVTRQLARAQGWDTEDLPPPFGAAPGDWNTYDRAVSLGHWLGRRGRPLMVVIEDLQWADGPSLELTRHLAARLAQWPVIVIATYRTDELSRRHPLWRLLPEMQRAGAARMLLGRLTVDDVGYLVKSALPPALATPQVAQSIHARTAGLPLFVREMLESVAQTGQVPAAGDPLPQTLQQALDAKLDRLPPGTEQVLAPAAVIGERFTCSLLARVVGRATEGPSGAAASGAAWEPLGDAAGEAPGVSTGVADDAVAEAIQAAADWHVIEALDADASAYAFTHALLREALLARMAGVRRRRWHERVGEVLAAGPDPDPDAVAFHLARAGSPRVADYLMAAGDRALRLGELTRARERFEQALALVTPDHPRRGELLLKLGQCLPWGEQDRAAALLQEAQAAATAAGDEPAAVWARHFLAQLALTNNLPQGQREAEAVMAAQSELLEDPRYQKLEADLFGQPAGYPRAGTLLVHSLTVRGNSEEAWTRLRELAAKAGLGADHEIRAAATTLLLLRGRVDEAAALCGQAAETARSLRDYREAVRLRTTQLRLLLVGRADLPDELDAVAESLEALEEEAWQRTGYAHLPRGFSLAGVYYYFRGNWRAAWKHVVDLAKQEPAAYEGTLVYHAGRMLLHSGDPAGARPFVEVLPPARPEDPVPLSNTFMILVHALRAELWVALGDPARARSWLEAADRWPALEMAPFFRSHIRVAWARYHRHMGNLDAA